MTSARKIAITGASGMVGYALGVEAVARGYEVLALARTNRHSLSGVQFHSIDLTEHRPVTEVLTQFAPDLLIHGAAITNHNECEENPSLAHALHVDATAHLAALMAKQNGRFVHLSTEAVYGNGNHAHGEEDECQPHGIYATTKLMGEKEALLMNPESLVLRVTPVGFSPNGEGRSLVEWLLGSLRGEREVVGFSDVFFTPIASFQLASLIFDLPGLNLRGTYNWGCADPISKFDFARRLAQALGFREDAVKMGRRYHDSSEHHGEMTSGKLAERLDRAPVCSADVIIDLSERIRNIKQ
jgi:dTDP-4-dehydrorhamnose reductase